MGEFVTSADQYRAAGVDLEAAEAAKRRIAALVASTQTPLSRGADGGFGGMVRVPPDVDRPVLVMSTDGVGTKVLVAIRAGRHETVGEDLVNHCVNDILVLGARPVAFLDYVAHANTDADTLAAIVGGVARGCRTHGMALVGGETAQLPDLYHPGHYDLAGTIVGVVADDHALGAHRVRPGDRLLGYAASGLHTNGYTLARRILFDRAGLDVRDAFPGTNASVADVLLAVHRSYWFAISPALPFLHALAHITGGGIPGNLVRSLPAGCGAGVRRGAWPIPAVFRVLQDHGGVTDDEMVRVFNMGIGMIAIVPPDRVAEVRESARQAAVETWDIGEVVEGEGVELS
jgi:phosphoribosylformylglycinamidine cyclo-ligase